MSESLPEKWASFVSGPCAGPEPQAEPPPREVARAKPALEASRFRHASKRIDVAIVQPASRTQVYQGLGSTLAAVEPPVWAGLIARHLRDRGYAVELIDGEAEELSPDQFVAQLVPLDPVLTTVVVFGHQPSASTQSMVGASALLEAIRAQAPRLKTLLVGGHVSALPERTLREEAVDFVCQGEGPVTIRQLVDALKAGDGEYDKVQGLWYRDGDMPRRAPEAPLIDDLDRDLPGLAWDLLPMNRYRAHNWHCFGRLDRRQPYASIYTSLGCPFKCTFCCINAPFGKPSYRYRSARSVGDELELLVTRYGVENVKILDEMFVLNYQHVAGVCDEIIQRGLDLNVWAYARVDTVKNHILDKLKRAGINWLALGIESGSQHVRDGALKKFGQADIKQTVEAIKAAGIHVIGNFIFGLPDDDLTTMQATLDLALDLNCEFANFYSAMAYPGSRLYGVAVAEGWPLPARWSGYSQHAVDTLPLPTRFVSAAEVLRFRDHAFQVYFGSPAYLALVSRKFGAESARHVREMAAHRLERHHA
jgi:anaerobic magnesium-protoporphyrin IX monomethyl ester cyclase